MANSQPTLDCLNRIHRTTKGRDSEIIPIPNKTTRIWLI